VENTIIAKKDVVNHISTAADPNSSSDNEYMYALSLKPSILKVPMVSVKISSVPFDMIVDTDTSIDILDGPTYNEIHQHSTILVTSSPIKIVCIWRNNPTEIPTSVNHTQ